MGTHRLILIPEERREPISSRPSRLEFSAKERLQRIGEVGSGVPKGVVQRARTIPTGLVIRCTNGSVAALHFV